jgi:hypothetical protein
MDLIPGLQYHNEISIKTPIKEEGARGNLGSLLNYHVAPTNVEALIENMKKMCPRFTPDSLEGLAFLAVHPALAEEEREKYKRLFYQKNEKECQEREQELIQTRKSCQSPVNQQLLNTTEDTSPMSDII